MASKPASAAPQRTEYSARLSRRAIVLTTTAALAGMFLATLDGTIVATAMPTIITDLHGLNQYAWVFTGFLLAQIATIPLWGRLADMMGRKRVFLMGMAIFLLGSALCGAASSMTELVAFRALQGVGAGCLIPVAQTIVADLYTLEQRTKMAALFAALFGFSAIAGPFLGGFITDTWGWRWVFYVNLPIGIVAFALVAIEMVEPLVERHRHTLDWAGISLLLGWTISFVFALEMGGRQYAWASPAIVGTFALSAVCFVGWIFVERRAKEPLIPLDLFRIRGLRASTVGALFAGMAMYGMLSFLPLFAQVVIGSSATNAGRLLTPMMLSMVLASSLGSRFVLKIGFRVVCATGFAFLAIGMLVMTRLGVGSTQLDVSLAMVVAGIGLGFVLMCTTLAAQSSVDVPHLGVATGLVNFLRQLGGAIGVALGAALMLGTLTDRISALFPHTTVKAGSLLSPEVVKAFPEKTHASIQAAFATSLHPVFVALFVVTVVGVGASFMMPAGRATDMRAHGGLPDDVLLADGETYLVDEGLLADGGGADGALTDGARTDADAGVAGPVPTSAPPPT